MARGRKAETVKKKINMLLFGEPFTGKSTFAAQAAYMHNEDGSPMKVLYIDCESGSIDNYLDKMEADGVDLGNIYILYTQSLGEILDYINKIKNNEDFYEIDENGNETEDIVVDANGNPFRPDIIIIDGVTVAHQAAQQGLLEFSKKRARVRANAKGLVGDEKLVSIEGSSLETRDWGNIAYKGSNLCLSLLGTGIHSIITCREKDETVTVKDSDGKIASVPTGKKIPAGFKNLDYNTHTVIRFYRDDDDEVCANVLKDRTNIHPNEILVDPQLLDWQKIIDNSVGKKDFVLNNTLDSAVLTEQEIYTAEVLNNSSISLSKSEMEKNKIENESNSADSNKGITAMDIKAEIKNVISKLDPIAKKAMKEKLESNNLPISYSKLTDVDVLNKILATISK